MIDMVKSFVPNIDEICGDYKALFDNYKINVPENFNFGYDVIDEWARVAPNKPSMIWCDDHGAEERFSCKDMSVNSNKAANVLLSLGIKKGDVIMTLLRRRYEFWFIAYAAHKIGATIIPATSQLLAKDIAYRCNAASVSMLVALNDDSVIKEVEACEKDVKQPIKKMITNAFRDGWVNYGAMAEAADEELALPRESLPKTGDNMLMYFTSGTTGFPKMAWHDYTYPLGHITTGRLWHMLTPESVHITVSDTGWAKCGWGKLYGQWITGAVQFIYDMDRFVPINLLEKLAEYKVTSFCAPPTIYRFLIKEDMAGYDLSALSHATTAGEPLNPEVFKRFKELTGVMIYEAFGQSESTPITGQFCESMVKPIPGSIGRPSPGYYIDLLDEDGNIVPDGDEGEVCIDVSEGRKPVGLFNGYYRAEEVTKAVWYDGYYHTGDIAWKNEDGYLFFVGRADDVIKSSGYRIGPFEVESALMEHEAVLECAVSAMPDAIRGQVVKATVVLAKGFLPSEELVKELQDHVKSTTAPYKYPRVVEFVDELPKTVSGKIKRAELRKKDEKNAPPSS